ncbi:hypothetical protein CSB37_03650 [bacterium DOLZORAL124_38_8]|nr:MAG: hypothetical protein CSB37_03650 [bacterium DOLZORAL124_38_8]
MLEQKLSKLGLKKEEATIYLELLQRGQTSVTTIANFTNIPRINCYHHLLNLKKKGFVLESRKNKMKHFSAEDPQIFLSKAQEQKNLAENVLPNLTALINTHSTKPKFQFFEDKSGINKIFERITQQEPHTIFSFTNFESLQETIPLEKIEQHLLKRVKKGIKSRFICAQNSTASILNEKIFKQHTDFFEVFFISTDKFPLQSEVTIFPNYTITLNLNQQTPIGTVVEDQAVYNAQKTIFDLAWMAATSFIGQ